MPPFIGRVAIASGRKTQPSIQPGQILVLTRADIIAQKYELTVFDGIHSDEAQEYALHRRALATGTSPYPADEVARIESFIKNKITMDRAQVRPRSGASAAAQLRRRTKHVSTGHARGRLSTPPVRDPPHSCRLPDDVRRVPPRVRHDDVH